jgi:hypothetical protein
MDFRNCIGLGVVGNFRGHLEQAGEMNEFGSISVEEDHAPKGLFPIYLPATSGQFIEVYPLSANMIARPKDGGKIQSEPEVALLCDLKYHEGKVTSLLPTHFAAYNDCSIRRPSAGKISERKNWGADSKGISTQHIAIDSFSQGGIMDNYRLVCFLRREGVVEAYGVDSPLVEYSYFHEKLVNWLVEKMNSQPDEGPLESISSLLETANYPKKAVISIGATRYTDFGEKTYLQAGDESFVIVYDSKLHKNPLDLLNSGKDCPGKGFSVLYQTVQ